MEMLLTHSDSSHVSNILFEHFWMMASEKVDENQKNIYTIFFFACLE